MPVVGLHVLWDSGSDASQQHRMSGCHPSWATPSCVALVQFGQANGVVYCLVSKDIQGMETRSWHPLPHRARKLIIQANVFLGKCAGSNLTGILPAHTAAPDGPRSWQSVYVFLGRAEHSVQPPAVHWPCLLPQRICVPNIKIRKPSFL